MRNIDKIYNMNPREFTDWLSCIMEGDDSFYLPSIEDATYSQGVWVYGDTESIQEWLEGEYEK